MEKVLMLAEKGRGKVNPHPMVGSVIVKNNEIVSKGYYKAYGEKNAELIAIENANESLKDAILYINMEPILCDIKEYYFWIKKIIETGIKKAVISIENPKKELSGIIINKLRETGIEVITGILEEKSKQLNEIYINYVKYQKPFVIMRSSMTLDGKIATDMGDSQSISGKESKKRLHFLRNSVSAIMVGSNTVLKNNPFLTARLEGIKTKNPIKIVIDSEGKIPFNYNVYDVEDDKKSILATTNRISKEYVNILVDKGVKVIKTGDGEKVDLKFLITELYKMGIDSILLEGGGILNSKMLEINAIDKVISFVVPKIIGGKMGKTPVYNDGIDYIKDAITLKDVSFKKFGNDVCIEAYILKEDGE
jgi:diaminohydroxyphosphoribosylaminopyrimidine deaminase/5-amino-6-(5-phosphoribosylamino)uracil reductase